MAQISWIKDNLTGRLGSIVGSSWKGIHYVKTFTPPANSNTAPQQEIRTAFKHLTHIGLSIKTVLEHTYPKPHKMTYMNRLVQINKAMLGEVNKWQPEHLQIFIGELRLNQINTATVDATNKTVTVTWTKEGNDTDLAFAVIHDEITEKTLYGQATRATESIIVDISEFDLTQTAEIHTYLVFVNDDEKRNSNTAYKKAS